MNSETILSSKAKGKQRAYPVARDTTLGQEMSGHTEKKSDPPRIELAIRFVDGSPDMLLEMSLEDTGASVMIAMREKRPELADKYLRLIHSGRMLAPHTSLSMLRPAAGAKSKEEGEGKLQALGRLSLSLQSRWSQDMKGKGMSDEGSDELLPSKVWLHCAATQDERGNAGDQDPAALDSSGAGTPRAYDRLTDAGLSTSDVQSIRALFRRVMYGSAADTTSGVGIAQATSSSWAPTVTEAHQLESQWLDSITQPSIFEESTPGEVDAASNPGTTRTPSFLSYLLPTTIHGSPARAMTQGLIFAFFFPFIAGSAVASEVLVRPPAFFDGEIWPELNREAVEMYAALGEARDGDEPDRATEGTNLGADVEVGESARQPLAQPSPTQDLAEPLDSADIDDHRSRPSGTPSIFFDMAMDPSPSLIFSPGMQAAIRAGLILNVVTGFYLWLYAS